MYFTVLIIWVKILEKLSIILIKITIIINRPELLKCRIAQKIWGYLVKPFRESTKLFNIRIVYSRKHFLFLLSLIKYSWKKGDNLLSVFLWTIKIKKMSLIYIKGNYLKQICGTHSEPKWFSFTSCWPLSLELFVSQKNLFSLIYFLSLFSPLQYWCWGDFQ